MGASGVSGGNCLERRARTNLCPGDGARLDDHFGLDAEVLRFPQDEVGERSDGDLADEMTDAMSYRAGCEQHESVNACKECQPSRRDRRTAGDLRVYGIFRDIALDPAVIVPLTIA